MRHRKRWGILGAVACVVTLMGSASWACVPEGTAKIPNINPREAKAGQEITVAVAPSASKSPVTIRLNDANGPLLGTIPVDGAPIPGEGFKATFKVPMEAKPGQNAVIAVQEGVTDWQPALLGVLDETGQLPKQVQSVAAAEAQPPDETVPRGAAGLLAVALAGLAVLVARRGAGDGVGRAGLWQRVQPSALALLAGAAAYAAFRPRLDGSLIFLGVIALAAGLLGRNRTHFIPVGLVLAGWGLAVWLVSEDIIPRNRSQAAAVTGLGLGIYLSARLARSPQQRSEWLYTGAICIFNGGFSYYVLYELPVAFARWSAFTIFLLGWAAWEQYRAVRWAGPAGEALPEEAGPDRVAEVRQDAETLAPSVR